MAAGNAGRFTILPNYFTANSIYNVLPNVNRMLLFPCYPLSGNIRKPSFLTTLIFMEERVLLAACLAHLKRADGSLEKDWSIAQIAWRGAHDLLKKNLAHAQLPDQLTELAFAASEDLRASSPGSLDWPATQAQAVRVLPVVMQLLYVLNALPQPQS